MLANDSNFLIGTWISDKEKTIEYNREREAWTSDQLKVFEKILGKLEVTFTESKISWSHEDASGESEYAQVEKSDNSITIRTNQTLEDVTYHKEGSMVYIEPIETKAFEREYFKRVE